MSARIVIAALIAAELIARSAGAAPYGDVGTVEVGGTASLGEKTSALRGGSREHRSLREVAVRPGIGYFVVPGFELSAFLALDGTHLNVRDGSTVDGVAIGGGVSAGYYVALFEGGPRLGPDARAEFVTSQLRIDQSYLAHDRGTAVLVGGTLKVPIGERHGGVISLGMHYVRESRTTVFNDDATKVTDAITRVTTDVGITAFF